MRHETEHQPRPRWHQTLDAYQHALARFRERPSLGTQIFWEIAREELEAELIAPGGVVSLGRVDSTAGAIAAMKAGLHLPAEFLIRHKHGDWGDLDAHDRGVNRREIPHHGRILSSYLTRTDEKLWVITAPGWRRTTLLLPKEY